MKFTLSLIAAAAAFTAFCAPEAKPAAKQAPKPHPKHNCPVQILISVPKGTKIIPVKGCAAPSWNKSCTTMICAAKNFAADGKWNNVTFSFKVDKDVKGSSFTLGGGSFCKPDYFAKQKNEVWIAADNIRLDGKIFHNSSFEGHDAKGGHIYEWVSNNLFAVNDANAKDGKSVLILRPHRQAAYQHMEFKKNVVYTISADFKFFACKAPEAAKK